MKNKNEVTGNLIIMGGIGSQFSDLLQFLGHQKINMHVRGKSGAAFSADSKK